MKNELLEKAGLYRAWGWNLIPKAQDGKTPISAWKEFQTRRQTDSEFKAAFEDPKAEGIALLPGPLSNNIIGIDIDAFNENDGNEQAILQYLTGYHLSDLKRLTRVEKTPHNGLHIYFYLDGIEGSYAKIDGIDFPKIGEKAFGIELIADSSHSITLSPTPNYTLEGQEESKRLDNSQSKKLIDRINELANDDDHTKIIKMILPYWKDGSRHQISLGIAAWLRYRGFDKDAAKNIIGKICRIIGDEEIADRLISVDTTFTNEKANYRDFLSEELINKLNSIKQSELKPINTGIFINEHGRLNIGEFGDWIFKKELFAHDYEFDALYHYNAETGIWEANGEQIINRYTHIDKLIENAITSQKTRKDIIDWIRTKREIGHDILKSGEENGLLPLKNGILDTNTYELKAYEPDDYFTWKFNIGFNTDALSPINTIITLVKYAFPDFSKFTDLLEVLSYPLVPGYPIKKAIALVGPRDKGKSAFEKIFDYIYDKKATAEPFNVLDPFRLQQLDGPMVSIVGELPRKGFKAQEIELFKQLTGGDTINSKIMHSSKPYIFKNSCKLVFSGNFTPKIEDISIDDEAFSDRWQIIPFENDINNKNPNFFTLKIEPEKDGIFVMLLVIANILKKNHRFTNQQELEEASALYTELSNNPLEKFMKEIIYDPEAKGLTTKEVVNKLNEYSKEKGLTIPSTTALGRLLLNKALGQRKRVKNGDTTDTLYPGLRFRNPKETESIDDEIAMHSELIREIIRENYGEDFVNDENAVKKAAKLIHDLRKVVYKEAEFFLRFDEYMKTVGKEMARIYGFKFDEFTEDSFRSHLHETFEWKDNKVQIRDNNGRSELEEFAYYSSCGLAWFWTMRMAEHKGIDLYEFNHELFNYAVNKLNLDDEEKEIIGSSWASQDLQELERGLAKSIFGIDESEGQNKSGKYYTPSGDNSIGIRLKDGKLAWPKKGELIQEDNIDPEFLSINIKNAIESGKLRELSPNEVQAMGKPEVKL